MLGNFGLLALGQRLARKKKLPNFTITIKEPQQEIYYIHNTVLQLNERLGSLVSIIPLAQHNQVKYQGFAYPLNSNQTTIRFGQSKGLRNRIVELQASLEVKGRVWVVLNNVRG